MSWTFVACLGVAFIWMTLFYIWGRGLLTFFHADIDIASCISFGYMVLQIIYQLVYLPFYLSRGSYRATVYIWLAIVLFTLIPLLIYLRSNKKKRNEKILASERIGVLITAVLVLGLAIYISLHVPFYGADTVTYISTMNNAYFYDSIWIDSGDLSLHHGLCSLFHLFTMSSLLTGIRPYYISLFTVRIVGVCLFSFILYHMGVVVFQNEKQKFSWLAAALSILVPTLLMFWGSNYTAEFFYWRINEAKGYCQFVLMPLGFTVFLEMFKENADRKELWKKQTIVGLGAIAVSSSSMTPYLFLILMGTCAILAFDKMRNGCKTIGKAVICILPNLAYLALYILQENGTLGF